MYSEVSWLAGLGSQSATAIHICMESLCNVITCSVGDRLDSNLQVSESSWVLSTILNRSQNVFSAICGLWLKQFLPL